MYARVTSRRYASVSMMPDDDRAVGASQFTSVIRRAIVVHDDLQLGSYRLRRKGADHGRHVPDSDTAGLGAGHVLTVAAELLALR